MSGRQVLYSAQFVAGIASALREAHANLDSIQIRHFDQLAELQAEVAELREVVLMVVSVLRREAEVDVATLRRQLETVLARLERDPDRPLH